jgi:hypothetical protein
MKSPGHSEAELKRAIDLLQPVIPAGSETVLPLPRSRSALRVIQGGLSIS